MRLEKQHEEELAKRKGMAKKTIIQFAWLAFSFVIAYFLVTYLFEEGYLRYGMFYSGLSVSPNDVPRWVFTGVMMLLIVFLMQTLFFIGFFFASPEGRRRTGNPSLHSRNKDPFDNPYN